MSKLRSTDRESTVARVLLRALDGRWPTGRALVVDDIDGAVAEGLADRAEVVRWDRRAFGGRDAAPWPVEGDVDAAFVRLPPSWAELEMSVHAAASRVRPGGEVWVYGANDEGIKSAPKRLDYPFLAHPDTVEIKYRARAVVAERTDAPIASTLDDWARTVELNGRAFVSFPGVFAEGRVDGGTAQLLKALEELPVRGRVLDFACGIGVVGAAVADRADELVLTDVDAVAIEAARRNLPDAVTRVADGMSGLDGRFDVIVSNPPFHRGKSEDLDVLVHFVQESARRLNEDGMLVAVAQRALGLGDLLGKWFERARLARKSPGFEVWVAR